jgi:hydroxypyruvate isomerase
MTPFKQSFAWWCYANRGVEPKALLEGAAKIGYQGIDLLEDVSHFPVARDLGLNIAAVGGHTTLSEGLNRADQAERIAKELRANIAKAHEWKIPVLICFSGNRHGASDEAGIEECARQLAKLAPEAEQAGTVLAIELLNSKVDHVGYQCDHASFGVEVCKRVNSPAVKVLYDIYHAQIMEGDIIRTIEKDHAYFGHYHTAGNPGRGPNDETQEIYYPPIYRAIAKTGYTGYLAHEFYPKGNPLEGMKKAFDDTVAALA